MIINMLGFAITILETLATEKKTIRRIPIAEMPGKYFFTSMKYFMPFFFIMKCLVMNPKNNGMSI